MAVSFQKLSAKQMSAFSIQYTVYIVVQVLIIAYFSTFSNKILLVSTLFITQQTHFHTKDISHRRFCITLNRQNVCIVNCLRIITLYPLKNVQC